MKSHTSWGLRFSALRTIAILGAIIIWAGLLAGCASHMTDARVAAQPVVPVAPYLSACAAHAARGQRTALGDTFKMLQLSTDGILVVKPTGPVGYQPVAYAYDGTGDWWAQVVPGRTEWRKIHFHCLVNPQGHVVYSFVRGM